MTAGDLELSTLSAVIDRRYSSIPHPRNYFPQPVRSVESIWKSFNDAVESEPDLTHHFAEFLARFFMPPLRCSVFLSEVLMRRLVLLFVFVETLALTLQEVCLVFEQMG